MTLLTRTQADDYISLMDAMSDNRTLPEQNRSKLYEGLYDATMTHGGVYKYDCTFQLYMGRK